MYKLGISGLKQSGKDTVCKMLIPILRGGINQWFQRKAFADAVKNVLCMFSYEKDGAWFQVDPRFIEEGKVRMDYVPGGWNMNVRHAMINIGDRLREICPTVWLDIVMRDSTPLVISDVRYKNEAWAVHDHPRGYLVRVIRDGNDEVLDNPSETELLEYDRKLPDGFEGAIQDPESPYDFVIRNQGSLGELEQKVRHLLYEDVRARWAR